MALEREFRLLGMRVPIPVPDFWRLWLVGLILFLGRWFDTLAMSVYVYQETRSAFLVSLLMVLRFLPMSLFGMIFADIADRVERRTLLLGINLSLLGCALVLALLQHAGMLAVWHLMVASFIGGLSTAADNPVRRLMMGEVMRARKWKRPIMKPSGMPISAAMPKPIPTRPSDIRMFQPMP